MLGEIEADVFPHCQRTEQGSRLEDHGQAISVHDPGRLDRLVLDPDVALIGGLEADEMLEQDALAAATRSHDHEDLASLDLEGQPFEDFLAIVALAEIAHRQAHATVGFRIHQSRCINNRVRK